MSETEPHTIKTEPKFCRCRLCHRHFYGDTVEAARRACQTHEQEAHPGWGEGVCYCPE